MDRSLFQQHRSLWSRIDRSWPLRTLRAVEPVGIVFAAIAVIYAAIQFDVDHLERQKAREVQRKTLHSLAWQTIQNARGKRFNAGAAEALEFLSDEGFSKFGRIDLADTWLIGASLRGVNLRAAELSGALLTSADLSSSFLRNATMSGAELHRTNLEDANLQSVDSQYASFFMANLKNANLKEADLTEVDLDHADLRGAILDGAIMKGATFSGSNLEGSSFKGADLSGANFRTVQNSYLGPNLETITLPKMAARGLTVELLKSACADPEAPPMLPEALNAHPIKPCS